MACMRTAWTNKEVVGTSDRPIKKSHHPFLSCGVGLFSLGGERKREMESSNKGHEKRMKVLCLHGFRTSGSFLQKQISKWDPSFLSNFDMVFLTSSLLYLSLWTLIRQLFSFQNYCQSILKIELWSMGLLWYIIRHRYKTRLAQMTREGISTE